MEHEAFIVVETRIIFRVHSHYLSIGTGIFSDRVSIGIQSQSTNQ